MSFELQWLLVLGGIGIVMTWAGWAAWTGRYRGWVKLGRGYQILAMLPAGAGFLLLGAAPLFESARSIAVALGLLGALCWLLAFLYALATFVVKDRWYPRWYHQLPPDQREP